MTDGLVSDPQRQATDSIRGYVYQAFRSVWAWMRLGESESLFLEGAEDFDILSGFSAITTQVKDVARNVTLNSRDVVQAIANFWTHQERNPGCVVRFRFMTTAARGCEAGAPIGRPGLDYWEAAVRGAPLGPLREVLKRACVDPPSLVAFLNDASDSECRERLLSRIEWDTGQRPLEGLIETIEGELVEVGYRLGIPPTDSVRALGSLLKHVAVVLSRKGNRELKHHEFLRLFEDATTVQMARGEAASLHMLQAQMAGAALRKPPSPPVFGPALPLLDKACHRTALVARLAEIAEGSGVLFLWGSTGLGKTSLARLVTDRLGHSFGWAEFRNLGGTHIAERLAEATAELRGSLGEPRVVLDDLDLGKVSAFERELVSLSFAIRQARGTILVTGYSACPEDLLAKMWVSPEAVQAVPYFVAEDVEEVLLAHGAPAGGYAASQARVTLLSTHGHPQLVHARVRRLAREEWPQPSASDLPADASISDVRTRARERILKELPSDPTRSLVYRLSLALGRFARVQASVVGEVAPKVDRPGECLDILVGPWVEKVGTDEFRVSPLLGDSGTAALSDREQKLVHVAFAVHALQSKSVAPENVATALFHGLLGKSRDVLSVVARLLMTTNIRETPGLADALFAFSALRLGRGEYLFDGDALLDVLLRVGQFKAASAARQPALAKTVVERALEGVARADAEVRGHVEVMLYGTVLGDVTVGVPPGVSIPMLARFMRLVESDPVMKELAANFANKGPPSSTATDLSPFQVLFHFETARMEGIEWLSAVIDELERLDPGTRNHLFSSRDADELATLLVNNAWLHDATAKTLDVARALQVAERTRQRGLEWGLPCLGRAGVLAAAVLCDEYAKEPDKALTILDRAAADFGAEDPRLAHGRSKVLFGLGRMADAAEGFERALNGGLDPVDRVFASRLRGVALGRLGRWSEAGEAFTGAATVALNFGIMKTMAAGLLADAAYARWKTGDSGGAVSGYADALEALERVPVDSNLSNRHVHATVRHSIAWLWAVASERRVPDDLAEPLPGMCSNPDPHQAMAQFEIREGRWSWALLAIAERTLGVGHRVTDRAKRTGAGQLPRILQAAERGAALDALRGGKEIEEAASVLLGVVQSNAAHRRLTVMEMWTPAPLDPLPEGHWDDPANRAYLAKLLVAIGAICAARNSNPPVEAWRMDLIGARACRDEIAAVLEIMEGRGPRHDEGLLGRAAQAVRELGTASLTPADLFRSHFTVLNLLSGGDAEFLASDSLGAMAESWRRVAEAGRFALVAPAANAPQILAACDAPGVTGAKLLAAVLLAALPGTGVRLDERGRAFLRDAMSGGVGEPNS